MTSTRKIKKAAVGVVSFLALAAAMNAQPALAQQNYHGAIAYSQQTGAIGWSYDFSSRPAAENRALYECGKHGGGCRIATWFQNACGALAVGDGRGWGGSWGKTRHEAEANALRLCSQKTQNCSIQRWVCTTR